MDWQHLLFQFDGRINRAKFWAGVVAVFVVVLIVAIVAVIANSSAVWTLYALVVLLSLWPNLALSIKRWHDRGKTGWWVLIGLVPIIGGLWALIETGILAGDEGPNEYGPDPLAS
ncbi:MAG: DUF805 domain-containing protein [Acidimicrobiia bacterium]